MIFNKSPELQAVTHKNDNLVLTTSLIHNLQGNSKTNTTLLNLFRQTNLNQNQLNTLTFYKNLFTLNAHITQFSSDKMLLKTLQFNNMFLNLDSLLTSPQYKPYFNLILDYYLTTQTPRKNHSLNEHNLNKWSLGRGDTESLNTSLITNQPQGVFYLTNTSNQKINETIFQDKQPLV